MTILLRFVFVIIISIAMNVIATDKQELPPDTLDTFISKIKDRKEEKIRIKIKSFNSIPIEINRLTQNILRIFAYEEKDDVPKYINKLPCDIGDRIEHMKQRHQLLNGQPNNVIGPYDNGPGSQVEDILDASTCAAYLILNGYQGDIWLDIKICSSTLWLIKVQIGFSEERYSEYEKSLPMVWRYKSDKWCQSLAKGFCVQFVMDIGEKIPRFSSAYCITW